MEVIILYDQGESSGDEGEEVQKKESGDVNALRRGKSGRKMKVARIDVLNMKVC